MEPQESTDVELLSPAPPPLHLLRLGRRPYQEVWDLQRKLQSDLINQTGSETLILCEHPPTITIGKGGRESNILLGVEGVKNAGVEVFHVERGGDVTYHGPGQLVAYPIIDLSTKRKDVTWYTRTIEEVIIRTLREFQVEGVRITGKTGVWTGNSENGKTSSLRKIASLGVRISRWRTMHGFSINVHDCTTGFSLIHPCGYNDISVTSLEQEIGTKLPLVKLEDALIRQFLSIFGYSIRTIRS